MAFDLKQQQRFKPPPRSSPHEEALKEFVGKRVIIQTHGNSKVLACVIDGLLKQVVGMWVKLTNASIKGARNTAYPDVLVLNAGQIGHIHEPCKIVPNAAPASPSKMTAA